MSAYLRLCALAVLCAAILVAAKQNAPTIERTEFQHQPNEVLYFDDSEIVLITDRSAGIVHISNDGGTTWDVIEDLPRNEVATVVMNPYNNKVAVALGSDRRHWITHNQGKSWSEFVTDYNPRFSAAALSFHSSNSKKVILNTENYEHGQAVYTTDGFKTTSVLREKAGPCLWARERDLPRIGDAADVEDRVLCIVEGRSSARQESARLVISDDYFKEEYEPELEDGRPVSGIASMVAVKGYILVARMTEGTNEMALYVTTDTNEWHRAQFNEQRLEQDGYTIMESRNYSLQVDVMTGSVDAPVGMFFTSNSRGDLFTPSERFTNRDRRGYVDFENLQGVQGVTLVNHVENWEEVDKDAVKKQIISQISFDDGRTFQSLKAGNDSLHLHSVTEQKNVGRIYSSLAPGIVMGVGNLGPALKPYDDGALYISTDAGRNWKEVLDAPHKYEFGDQGSVLVAMWDQAEPSRIMYSTTHGNSWEPLELGSPIKPQILTTVPDSTSLKFLLLGTTGSGKNLRHWVYSIDFQGLNKRTCQKKDFETWYASVDDEGNPTCIMGHTQSYRRRKADADCFIDKEFQDPQPTFDNKDCPCTKADFECAYGFLRSSDREECLPSGILRSPEDACKPGDDTFQGPSGWQLIAGNECRKRGGLDLEKQIARPCNGTESKKPANKNITHEITSFSSNKFKEYYYLERSGSSSGDDETVVMLTDDRELWLTHDHGKIWTRALEDEEITAIYPNRYLNDAVYFIGPSSTVFYSKNRGYKLHSLEAPARPNTANLPAIRFHPKNHDWLIWTSCKGSGRDCQPVASVTTKGGDIWWKLLGSVENCEFMWRHERGGSEKLIYCVQHEDEDMSGPKQLVASDDWFEHKDVHFNDMLQFATMSEFIIVAAKTEDERQALRVDSSIDGKTFAEAKFPSNFVVPHQSAYTVLDSSTHSIFLHVTVNDVEHGEFGSIIKSNSNGTSYVMSIDKVNRNKVGYVDFEKMLGLEGVAVVNIVANAEQAKDGSTKKLKTMITHNDGAEWNAITPPEMDADGEKYECIGKDIQSCSLHLHGYTERKDPRDTYSSPSAVGLMMGVGNVGEFLGRYKDGDTFVSRDGGITWRCAQKGQYMWEYGDQGSIIVIVEENTPTDHILYSRDEGMTWTEYEFSEEKMQIDDISTVPSDTSMNFLLWGRDTTKRAKATTINIDFSGVAGEQCKLDENNPDTVASDYELWQPKHPLQDDNCLFGHVSEYHRKKLDRNCYNGPKIDRLHSIGKNCSCSRQDFEW